jgi:hypothetical protein
VKLPVSANHPVTSWGAVV